MFVTTLYVFLSRFQAKGMDIGVADESLNGIPYEESSESEEDEEAEETEGEETKKHLIEIETLRSPTFPALLSGFSPLSLRSLCPDGRLLYFRERGSSFCKLSPCTRWE